MLRLLEVHFISKVLLASGKSRVQGNIHDLQNLAEKQDTKLKCRDYGVALCLSKYFEIHRTLKIKRESLGMNQMKT